MQSSQGDEHFSSTRKTVVPWFLSILFPATVFVRTWNESVGAGAFGTMKSPIGIDNDVPELINTFVFKVISDPSLVHASNWVVPVVHVVSEEWVILLGKVITMNPPAGIGFVFLNQKV